MIGQTISHYCITEKLGEGGMGVVWKAQDLELGRFVALKSLAPRLTADESRSARFLQEARAASALNHPNIVTIYDLLHHQGATYLVMEFIEGKSLDHLIPRHGLRLNEALKIAIQIADALTAAHKAGIVHRDLKPGNVMVTPASHVKVLDFGLAKLTERDPADAEATLTLDAAVKPKTVDGAILGTPSYMSPEQAEAKPVDSRSDIFSFGAVLYEMVTGRSAFQRESILATLSAILREEPKPIPDAPRDLEKILARCLRKDSERRAQHMADVKLALEELREESASGQISAPAQKPRRARWPWAVAAAVALAAAAAVGWTLFQPKPAQPPRLITVTSFPGQEESPALSPEGKQVAFTWEGEDQKGRGIFVKLVDTGTPLRLTTGPDSHPAWSPDGRHVAFVRLGRESGYFVVPALGGPERRIAAIPRIAQFPNPSLDWSRDGKQLVIVDTSLTPPSLAVVPLEGGAPKRLSSPPADTFGDSLPSISPDGRSIAFLRRLNTGGISEFYRADFNGTAMGPARLIYKPSPLYRFGHSWARDGRAIIASDQFQGQVTLIRIPVTGSGLPTVIPGAGSDAIEPAVALEADRLAFSHSIWDTNLWRMPLNPQGAAAAEQVFASSKPEMQADYSPDGKRIVFVSGRSGTVEIWIANADGSNPIQLTSNLDRPLRPRWSPDGRHVAFAARPGGNVDVYVAEVNGGPARRLTTHSHEDSSAQWSRNGKWVYFSSTRSGRLELFKIPADGSSLELQITRDGGATSRETRDGQFLYFVKGQIPGIWRMPAAGGAETRILEADPFSSWDIVGDQLYFHDGPRIRSLDLSTGKVTDITGTDPRTMGGAGGFSVTPDGKWLLYARRDQAASDILLLDNFR